MDNSEKKETIEEYARRLCEQIDTANPLLLGLSFGGMIAIEVAKHIPVKKIILISSVKTKNEIPFYYRIVGSWRLHKFLPIKLLKRANRFTFWLFGITSWHDKRHLTQILKNTDPQFLLWAIDKIVCWKNNSHFTNISHIHGGNDRILPVRYLHADRVIGKGGHLMILNQAKELNSILENIFKQI